MKRRESSSTKKRHANQVNAQKSTGPRTAKGRERASLNAIKHGLVSDKITIFADETPEQFATVYAKLRGDRTAGADHEAKFLEHIVSLIWKQRRLARLQSEIFSGRARTTDLSNVLRYERSLGRQLRDAIQNASVVARAQKEDCL